MNTPDERTSTVEEKKLDQSQSQLLDNDPHFPDGGLIAWSTTLGAQVFLIQIGGFGFINAFGVFQDFYSRQYLTNVSSSTISWIGSTNSFLILSGGLFFGPLYDRGYFHWLVIGGCILQTICLFMLSLTQQNQYYQIFLSHGLGFGLASSMSYVPSLAVLSHHFKKKRAIAMSIATAGTPLGGVAYTILLNNLLSGTIGFANSIRTAAAVNTVVLFVGCALMRTGSLYPETPANYFHVLRTSSADYPYIFASIGLFLYGAGAFFPIFYIQLESSMHGLGQVFSFYSIVILNGGNFIGRCVAGFIAKWCGLSNAVIGTTLCSGVLTFAMATLPTRAAAANIAVFIGFFAGAYVALSAPLITRLTHDMSELGARMGFSLFLAGLGSLIGTPLAGALLGSDYRWWKPAALCGCFCIASTIMFVIAQLILQRKRQTVSAVPLP